MTYSIIARDPVTGETGVAIQSYYYACGLRTIAALPGGGAVVVQMIPDQRYADEALPRMRQGEPPEDILSTLIQQDEGRDMRQVAMLDTMGRVAAFTGQGCIPASGHLVGVGCSVHGAMVESPRVWEQMMEAFVSATGALPERMLTAMRAGEMAGGDIRGKRAAALLVVAARESESWPESRPLNIRVDDHPDPLSEVERHVGLQRTMNEIELAFVRGLNGDVSGAVDDYRRLATSTPDDPDVTMRYGILLALSGDLDGARVQLKKMSGVHEGWAKVPSRLIASKFLPDDQGFESLMQ